MKIHHLKWYLLSKSNTFDQNFMKLGHIVEYHEVFFKFDKGPYRTMLSAIMALCLWKFTILTMSSIQIVCGSRGGRGGGDPPLTTHLENHKAIGQHFV